jgi:hypothetical protein
LEGPAISAPCPIPSCGLPAEDLTDHLYTEHDEIELTDLIINLTTKEKQ